MNAADSQRVASALEQFGCQPTRRAEDADIIVLNTCVVRQSAEDKAYGRLHTLRPLKEHKPNLVINLMGCLVGIRENPALRQRFPFVDVFSPPSDPGPLMRFLAERDGWELEAVETTQRFAWQDGNLALPAAENGKTVSAFIPVVYGCSHACTFCIIPYRRGVERSRPPEEILAEVKAVASLGVKEVTLLGQIVDRYGKDQPEYPDLAGLLHQIHSVEGITRIRFLTSHPNWMSDELLHVVAKLPKVMPHIEIPAQAGDDQVLANMRRGYTDTQYRNLVARIRDHIPGVSIATDIIVGFPGETEGQFMGTYRQLADLKLDVVHLARYSPRPGTVASRSMADDVPDEEKWRRFRMIEQLQSEISAEIYGRHLGQTVEVLFEDISRGRWRGRTPTNKLVFAESGNNLRGQTRQVRITWTGPYSMRGEMM